MGFRCVTNAVVLKVLRDGSIRILLTVVALSPVRTLRDGTRFPSRHAMSQMDLSKHDRVIKEQKGKDKTHIKKVVRPIMLGARR